MDRNKLIAEQASSIQQGLEAWASEVGFLKPGEQLVFTMEIVTGPLVAQNTKNLELIRTMAVNDFFTYERLNLVGGGRPSVRHVLTAIEKVLSRRNDIKTMRDFINSFPTGLRFREAIHEIDRNTHFTQTRMEILTKVLRDAGFGFPNS